MATEDCAISSGCDHANGWELNINFFLHLCLALGVVQFFRGIKLGAKDLQTMKAILLHYTNGILDIYRLVSYVTAFLNCCQDELTVLPSHDSFFFRLFVSFGSDMNLVGRLACLHAVLLALIVVDHKLVQLRDGFPPLKGPLLGLGQYWILFGISVAMQSSMINSRCAISHPLISSSIR